MLLVSSLTSAGEFDVSETFASDIRFRGISQTELNYGAASQIEYRDPTEFWMGNKLNNYSTLEYPNGMGVESDYFGGILHKFNDDLKVYAGDYQYTYPGAKKYNTNELFTQVRYGPFTTKFYQSMSNYFATPNSIGTHYYSVDHYLPINNITWLTHVGHTSVAHNSSMSYTDWRTGPMMNVHGFDMTLFYYRNTNTSTEFKNSNSIDGHRLYTNAIVYTVGKSW